MPKKWMVVAATGLAAIVALWISGAIAQRPDAAPPGEAALPVEVSPVTRGDIERHITLTGSVEARARAKVYAKIPGRVRQLNVAEGQRVRKGQVLAVIDETEMLALGVVQAEQALLAAETGLQQAKKLARVRLEAQLEQAQAGVAAAETALEQVSDLSYARVKAQIDAAEAGLAALKANLGKIREGALLIPRVALLTRATDRGYVFVVEGGRAVRREVVLGLAQNSSVEVVSGLGGAEQVVVAGQTRLRDGAPVRVLGAPSPPGDAGPSE
jgi:multidrug efflux pump subunit AcrA (membrane-fusion protein)